MRELISRKLADRLGLDLDLPHVTIVVRREGGSISVRGFPKMTRQAAANIGSFLGAVGVLRDRTRYVATCRPYIPGSMALLADSRPVPVDSKEFKAFGSVLNVLVNMFVPTLHFLLERLDGFHREVSKRSRELFVRAARSGREDLLVPGNRTVVSVCHHCFEDRNGQPPGPDAFILVLPMEIGCLSWYFGMATDLLESIARVILADIEEAQLHRINLELAAAGLSVRAKVPEPFDIRALLRQDS